MAECKGCNVTSAQSNKIFKAMWKTKKAITDLVDDDPMLKSLVALKREKIKPCQSSTCFEYFDDNCSACHHYKEKYDAEHNKYLEERTVYNFLVAVFDTCRRKTLKRKTPSTLLWDSLAGTVTAMRLITELQPHQKRGFLKLQAVINEVVEDMFPVLKPEFGAVTDPMTRFGQEVAKLQYEVKEMELPAVDIDFTDLRNKRKADLPIFSAESLKCPESPSPSAASHGPSSKTEPLSPTNSGCDSPAAS